PSAARARAPPAACGRRGRFVRSEGRTQLGVEADRCDTPDLDYRQPGRRQDHHHAPGHHHAWPDLGRGARRRRGHRRTGAHCSRPRGGRRPAGRPGARARLADQNHVHKSLALIPRRWVTVAQGALLAAIYFGAARFALLLAIPPGYATALWPPSGIALAALLVLGPRLWPGVWIGSALDVLALAALLLAATHVAFSSGFGRTFVIVPLIVWAAFRFGQREVTTAIAVVCALALWYTLSEESGPFAAAPLNESLLLLLAFISAVVFTGLILCAVISELNRAMGELQSRVLERTRMLSESERRFRLMVESV